MNLPTISLLETPGQKLTLLVLGGGMMGCDSRLVVVTAGYVETAKGPVLAYKIPRGRKTFGLLKPLEPGAIVLKGDQTGYPVFESHLPAVGGVHSFIMDGVGGRFADFNNRGPEVLADFLCKNLLLHTLTPKNTIRLLRGDQAGERVEVPGFKELLLDRLGPPLELVKSAPAAPTRKTLLTPRMLDELKAANDGRLAKALYKIFLPDSACTWLLCSLEDDGDTLWAVCDIGQGCVEYGTVSLTELETVRSNRFKYAAERDLHFDGSRLEVKDLLSGAALTC